MIHYVKEGHYHRIGLNFGLRAGGFVLCWAWYSIPKHETVMYRFRFRWHIKPRFLWSKQRFNVIDDYCRIYGLALVQCEVLEDLKLAEQGEGAGIRSMAYLKEPGRV